jgi:hypothetical protein
MEEQKSESRSRTDGTPFSGEKQELKAAFKTQVEFPICPQPGFAGPCYGRAHVMNARTMKDGDEGHHSTLQSHAVSSESGIAGTFLVMAVRRRFGGTGFRPKHFDQRHGCVTSRPHSCPRCSIPVWAPPPTQANPGHQTLDCYPTFLGFSRGKSNRS